MKTETLTLTGKAEARRRRVTAGTPPARRRRRGRRPGPPAPASAVHASTDCTPRRRRRRRGAASPSAVVPYTSAVRYTDTIARHVGRTRQSVRRRHATPRRRDAVTRQRRTGKLNKMKGKDTVRDVLILLLPNCGSDSPKVVQYDVLPVLYCTVHGLYTLYLMRGGFLHILWLTSALATLNAFQLEFSASLNEAQKKALRITSGVDENFQG
jgi:hypothetical protein